MDKEIGGLMFAWACNGFAPWRVIPTGSRDRVYGVKQEIQTAANYFSKSYIAGNAESALYLASMAERDDITYELPDEFSAKSPFSLYLEAADLGYPRAAYSLARIYCYGTEQRKPVPK